MTDRDSTARAESTPWIRNADFKDWVEDAIAAGRAAGATIEQVARRGGISRQQLNRWRGIGGPQSLPGPDSVLAFCAGNGLAQDEPFRLLGWAARQAGPAAAESMTARQIRSAMGEIMDALEQPGLSDADADELLDLMRVLALQLRSRGGPFPPKGDRTR